MTTDTTITIENNVLTFNYFYEQPKNSGWETFDENIKGIYYKAEYTPYPYLPKIS